MFSDLDSLRQQIPIDGIHLYSFDIFDTVFSRATGTPDGIFFIMQERLSALKVNLPSHFSDEFQRYRHNAAKLTRRELQKECSLSDIYSYLQNKFGLTDRAVDELNTLEIQVELECVRPISSIIRLINELYRQKQRVIFITDMYLPQDVLLQMLIKVGVYCSQDQIYVSHEFDKTKKHGDLYPAVLQKENCIPDRVLHIGDNKRADHKSAKRNGINSFYFKETRINRFEKILLEKRNGEFSSIGQKLSGASRQARLHSPIISKHQQTLFQIGANIAGPVLLMYVKWILQEAERNNLQRLYFLARDGQILLQIARRIHKYSGFRGELRYLYASRQALYVPATTEIDDKIISWILLKKQYLSLGMIANRTGLDVAMLQRELKALSGTHYAADYHFNTNEIKILQSLLHVPNVQKAILDKAAEWRINAKNYLEQEGLFEDIPYGVVDLGVKGTLQDCIKDILLMYFPDRKNELYGFYFGVNRFGKISGKYKKKFGYLFAPDQQQIHCPVSFSATRILEIFTTGDHGLTLAYTHLDNGIWGPLLKEKANTDILEWGLLDLREGIEAFLEALCRFGEDTILAINPNEQKDTIIALLSTLANLPNRDEAEAIGDHPFKNDPVESYTVTFAPAFNLNLALTHMQSGRNSELTSWIEGTCARSSFMIRCILEPLRFLNFTKEGIRKGVMLWHARKSVPAASNLDEKLSYSSVPENIDN